MATSWANSGGPKFYQGTKHENPWNQAIHQRMVNNKENKFMLAIQVTLTAAHRKLIRFLSAVRITPFTKHYGYAADYSSDAHE